MFLGRELRTRIGSLDDAAMESATRKVMGRLNPRFKNFKTPVKSLSGGQRQSVAIARAIHFNARILIMDEPTAALGPAETAQVRELVAQLKSEGIGIFLISHDIHDVFDLSDRISVMLQGKLVGTVEKDDVTKDEVLAMIIMGKQPGEVTEKELGRAPQLTAGRRRGRRRRRAIRRRRRAVTDRPEDRRQRRVELAVDRVGLGVARRVGPGRRDRRRRDERGRPRPRRSGTSRRRPPPAARRRRPRPPSC